METAEGRRRRSGRGNRPARRRRRPTPPARRGISSAQPPSDYHLQPGLGPDCCRRRQTACARLHRRGAEVAARPPCAGAEVAARGRVTPLAGLKARALPGEWAADPARSLRRERAGGHQTRSASSSRAPPPSVSGYVPTRRANPSRPPPDLTENGPCVHSRSRSDLDGGLDCASELGGPPISALAAECFCSPVSPPVYRVRRLGRGRTTLTPANCTCGWKSREGRLGVTARVAQPATELRTPRGGGSLPRTENMCQAANQRWLTSLRLTPRSEDGPLGRLWGGRPWARTLPLRHLPSALEDQAAHPVGRRNAGKRATITTPRPGGRTYFFRVRGLWETRSRRRLRPQPAIRGGPGGDGAMVVWSKAVRRPPSRQTKSKGALDIGQRPRIKESTYEVFNG
jgi:hypothetical protein